MLSNLPRDLAEDVLARVPAESMCAVRSVCKKWNTLSKNQSFTKKHLSKVKAAAEAEGGFLVVMAMEEQVSLMSVNLHEIHNNVEPSINHQGKLVSLTDPGQVDISKVFHCDGLLLCIIGPLQTTFVVWNPYSGQTRCFEPVTYDRDESLYSYAIGYGNSKSYHSHKVLRFSPSSLQHIRYELYYLNPKSSRDITIPITILTDWVIEDSNGVSVKGNTYWFAQRHPRFHIQGTVIPNFLICFDFTRERFGPRLSLPFQSYAADTVTLSSVRDEQLAVLFQRWDTFHMEIWITTKIEPEMASWSKLFLAVDMNFQFPLDGGSFFVDEEKKVAVVFERDDEKMIRVAAYVIGEDGYFKKVDIGEASNMYSNPPVLCSYVPSLAHTKRSPRSKRKKPKYYQ